MKLPTVSEQNGWTSQKRLQCISSANQAYKKKGSIDPLHALRQEIQLYVNYFPVSMQLGK